MAVSARCCPPWRAVWQCPSAFYSAAAVAAWYQLCEDTLTSNGSCCFEELSAFFPPPLPPFFGFCLSPCLL